MAQLIAVVSYAQFWLGLACTCCHGMAKDLDITQQIITQGCLSMTEVVEWNSKQWQLSNTKWLKIYEPRHEKTRFLHMRKQRHRSASR